MPISELFELDKTNKMETLFAQKMATLFAQKMATLYAQKNGNLAEWLRR